MSANEYCTCCGRLLKPDRMVLLELDQRNGSYHDFKDVPADLSQGWFPFGPSCANKKRKEARSEREVA